MSNFLLWQLPLISDICILYPKILVPFTANKKIQNNNRNAQYMSSPSPFHQLNESVFSPTFWLIILQF